MHRDLKLANVLVDIQEIRNEMSEKEVKRVQRETDVVAKTRVKIADMGFAKQMDHSTDLAWTCCGTPL